MRGAVPLVLAAFVLLAPRGASAQSPLDACFSSHAEAQSRRLEGALLDAREALRICAAEPCPSVVRAECEGWLREVRREVPSVRFSLRRGDVVITDARVYADGRLVAESIDPTREHEIDPGVYAFRFEHAEHGSVEVATAVRRGERGRVVAAELVVSAAREVPPGALEVTPSTPPSERFVVPDSAWVTGAVALGLFAGAAGLGAAALVERDQAMGSCAPFCDAGLVDRLRAELITADVLWVAGGAAAITAVVLLFVDRPSSRASDEGARVGLAPGGIWWW